MMSASGQSERTSRFLYHCWGKTMMMWPRSTSDPLARPTFANSLFVSFAHIKAALIMHHLPHIMVSLYIYAIAKNKSHVRKFFGMIVLIAKKSFHRSLCVQRPTAKKHLWQNALKRPTHKESDDKDDFFAYVTDHSKLSFHRSFELNQKASLYTSSDGRVTKLVAIRDNRNGLPMSITSDVMGFLAPNVAIVRLLAASGMIRIPMTG